MITQATTPEHFAAARSLMAEYGAFIAAALGPAHACHTSLGPEIAALETRYGPPRGFVLLAQPAGQKDFLGCIAVHELSGSNPARAEIKRLWVAPAARGCKSGSALLDSALDRIRRLGYCEAVLDTLPSVMPEAVRLYESRGFQLTERFNDNPVPGVVFYRRTLD
jgi:ribosomal protein S18 acetylase RimI-like enzyme